MPRFSKSVRVPYSTTQAFDLVSDVARYPDFIKWITALRVSDHRVDEAGVRHCRGDAVVGFKGFVERFSTTVSADVSEGGCDIALQINYEFRNVLIAMLAAANHDIAVDRIMSAFLLEAQKRYGDAPNASVPG